MLTQILKKQYKSTKQCCLTCSSQPAAALNSARDSLPFHPALHSQRPNLRPNPFLEPGDSSPKCLFFYFAKKCLQFFFFFVNLYQLVLAFHLSFKVRQPNIPRGIFLNKWTINSQKEFSLLLGQLVQLAASFEK